MKIDVNAMARRVELDNRIPLHHYYRIADSLLKQASIYRDENNIVDLYIILLRYSSLVSETIPFHRDYQRLLAVLDELESLKPEVQWRVEELNKARAGARLVDREGTSNGSDTNHTMLPSDWTPVNKGSLNIPQITLSRHSILGLNGFRGHWLGPSAEIKPESGWTTWSFGCKRW